MASYDKTVGPVPATGQYGQNYRGKLVIRQTPVPSTLSSIIDWAFYIWDAIGSSHYEYRNGNQIKVTIGGEVKYQNGDYGLVALAGTSESNPLFLCGTAAFGGYQQNFTYRSDDNKIDAIADYYQPSASALLHITPSALDNRESGGTDDRVVLEAVASAAEISSCPDLTLTGTSDHTVSWATSASNLFYRVQYKFSDTALHTGTMLAGTGNAMSYTWEDVPVSIAENAPSASSMTVTAILGTYSTSDASSVIGTDSENFTVSLNTSAMGPEISDLDISFAGMKGTSFVGGKSSCEADCEVTAQEGATVSEVYAQYSVYNKDTGTYSDIAASKVIGDLPITLGEFPETEFGTADRIAGAVKIVATDSRGNSSSVYSEPFVVYKLSAPAVSMLTLVKCDLSGNDDDTGAYLKAYVNYSLTSLNAQNEKHMGFTYGFVDADPSTWTTPTVEDPAAYSGTVTLGPYALPVGDGAIAATAYAWDAYTASDKASKDARLRGGEAFITAILNDSKDKKSIAFGGVSDEVGTTKSFWPIVAEDGLDVVKDRGIATEAHMKTDGSKIWFEDDDENVLLEIDPTVGITFKDTSGTTTASYPATT